MMRLLPVIGLLFLSSFPGWGKLPAGLSFEEGPINAVSLERNGERMSLYRATEPAKVVLLTHARRDLVEAVRPAAAGVFVRDHQISFAREARVVAPEKSRPALTQAEAFWEQFWKKRFNYYEQQVNKVPVRSLAVNRFVKEGELVKWQDLELAVMETPGYSRDAVTYLTEVGGKRIAFTGDLIWEGGRVFDLYSFQDAIPEARIGGYHGYGGRFGQWVASVQKLAAWKPDLIVPARGPLITNPAGDLAAAVKRVQAIYKNYLSTNALHWYFGKERLELCGKRVLGPGAKVELMPFSEHIALPPWCRHMSTTKLLVSSDGHGFALDVGGEQQLQMLRKALADGLIRKIEGIWVTHLHNDHTARVPAAAREFGCPVYAVAEVADGLRQPGAWFLPGLIPEPVDEVVVKKDGEKWAWREFTFTSHFFPGQMYNHGGLLVERADHKPVFFIGDSFSPSGIDDYCLMNRNLMREDTGYFLCLRKVRALPPGSWLVNQHIPHLFRFSGKELDYLEESYHKRATMVADLVPWDDPNYAIDEEWAWFHPYASEARAGERLEVELRLWNHSPQERTFGIRMEETDGLKVVGELPEVTLAPRTTGKITVPLLVDPASGPEVRVITASLRSEGISVEHWVETLVKVSE